MATFNSDISSLDAMVFNASKTTSRPTESLSDGLNFDLPFVLVLERVCTLWASSAGRLLVADRKKRVGWCSRSVLAQAEMASRGARSEITSIKQQNYPAHCTYRSCSECIITVYPEPTPL